MVETVLATSAVMIIICAASAFGFYMSWQRIPSRAAAILVELTQQPWLLLLLINLGLVVVGMLIEGTAALILLTPILVPAISKLGIDPLHFGLVLVVNLTIGGVTPPVGHDDVHHLFDPACADRGLRQGRLALHAVDVHRAAAHHLRACAGHLAADTPDGALRWTSALRY